MIHRDALNARRHRTLGSDRVLLVLLAIAPLPLDGVLLFTEALFAFFAAMLLAADARKDRLAQPGSRPGRWTLTAMGAGHVVFACAAIQTIPLPALVFDRPAALPGYMDLPATTPETIALAPGLAGISIMVAGAAIAVFAVANGLGRAIEWPSRSCSRWPWPAACTRHTGSPTWPPTARPCCGRRDHPPATGRPVPP